MRHKFTFEEIMKDPFFGNLIEILEEMYGRPLSEEMQSLLLDQIEKSQFITQHRDDWLKSTIDLCHKIKSGKANGVEYDMFWIRAYGIVGELPKFVTDNIKIGDLESETTPLVEAIDRLVRKLNNDEKALIRFMRVYHAHINIDYLFINARKKKDGSLKIKPPKDSDTLENLRKVFSSYEMDLEKMAKDIVSKILENIEEILKISENLGSI